MDEPARAGTYRNRVWKGPEDGRDHPWEDLAVFNPAAWHDTERQEVLLLYRAAEASYNFV